MKYDKHPRVRKHGDRGYAVEGEDGATYYVLHTQPFNWCICVGSNLEFVPVKGGGFAIGFRQAEHAIGVLIEKGQ